MIAYVPVGHNENIYCSIKYRIKELALSNCSFVVLCWWFLYYMLLIGQLGWSQIVIVSPLLFVGWVPTSCRRFPFLCVLWHSHPYPAHYTYLSLVIDWWFVSAWNLELGSSACAWRALMKTTSKMIITVFFLHTTPVYVYGPFVLAVHSQVCYGTWEHLAANLWMSVGFHRAFPPNVI